MRFRPPLFFCHKFLRASFCCPSPSVFFPLALWSAAPKIEARRARSRALIIAPRSDHPALVPFVMPPRKVRDKSGAAAGPVDWEALWKEATGDDYPARFLHFPHFRYFCFSRFFTFPPRRSRRLLLDFECLRPCPAVTTRPVAPDRAPNRETK